MTRACEALGLARATAYRRISPSHRTTPRPPRKSSPRALSHDERVRLLAVLDSDRFIDQPPREVYATLLEEGVHHCSVRTMYRLLRQRGPVRERRDHRDRGYFAVPRLEATAPNQVWTWDISKLPTHASGVFLSLYVILDLFSRYVVAWMVADHENSALAKQLFAAAISRYGIEPGALIVHQDRGAPMTSHGFAELLAQLGVDRSYSRPRVSNDNPFSESQFHTLKYQPDYPGRFADARHGRAWCSQYFGWYNDDHHHEGLALFTPADVYFARVDVIAQRRQLALDEAYARHPERFTKGRPVVRRPPSKVVLNPVAPGIVTVADIMEARDADVSSLWTAPPRTSTAPAIHLPGLHAGSPALIGGAPT